MFHVSNSELAVLGSWDVDSSHGEPGQLLETLGQSPLAEGYAYIEIWLSVQNGLGKVPVHGLWCFLRRRWLPPGQGID